MEHEFKAVVSAIGRLVLARAAAHGNDAKQAFYNERLNKLYEVKRTMIVQMAKK